MKHPSKAQWEAVKWILRFLKGTTKIFILYLKDGNGNETTCCVDLGHASDLDERRFSAGYAFTLVGGTVSWKAYVQDNVALSLTKAKHTLQ